MLVQDAVARAVAVFTGAGLASPRVEAELLVAYVLGVPRGRLVLAPDLSADQARRLAELVTARALRVPLQHLTGRAAFRRIELAVGRGVFVPRPETELLAGWGIAAAAARAEPVVVDLCAGSGAIALSVAHETPAALVYAVESYADALEWLRRNAAERAAAGDRPVEVVAADVTDVDALAPLAGRADVVLCNPPYVPEGVPVPPEVAGWDPATAVFAGSDGLAVVRPAVALAARLLRPGGAFGVEHDDGHDATVPALLAETGCFDDIEGHRDLADRPRYTTARRSG